MSSNADDVIIERMKKAYELAKQVLAGNNWFTLFTERVSVAVLAVKIYDELKELAGEEDYSNNLP